MERTLTVRLRALIGDYQAALNKAGADTKAASKTISSALNEISSSSAKVGGTLTRYLTLPLAGVGVGALKLSTDFESAFAQMVGLAGVAGSEVEGLRASVLRLAGETATSPQKLAEALYFVRSAGIDAAHAMQVLEASAKASASGMGDPAVIARTLSAALNAYGANNLSAAHATDVLVASIRAATFEPDQLAGALGTVIATASTMGITFDQLAGVLAVLSKTGLDANESATALNAIFTTLRSNSPATVALLKEHGLSLKGLRDVAAGPGGVVEVMRMLNKAFGDDDEALGTIIPNVRAFRGAMTILAQDAGIVDQVMRDVAGSTGVANDAFDVMSKTDAFKLKQDIAKMQQALIDLGKQIAPIAAQFGAAIATMANDFGRLPKPLQTFVVWLGLAAVALGPVIKGFSLLLDVAGPAIKFVIARLVALRAEIIANQLAGMSYGKALASSLAPIGAAMVAVTVVTIGATIALNSYAKQKAEATRQTDLFVQALKDEASGLAGAGDNAVAAALAMGGVGATLEKSGAHVKTLVDAIRNGSTTIGQFVEDTGIGSEQLQKDLLAAAAAGDPLAQELLYIQYSGNLTWKQMGDLINRINRLGNEFGGATTQSNSTAYALGKVSGNLQIGGLAASTFGSSIIEAGQGVDYFAHGLTLAETVVANSAAALAALDAQATIAANSVKRLGDAMDAINGNAFAVSDAQRGFADALGDVGTAATSSGGATRNLEKDQRALEKATKDVTTAQNELADAEQALADARKGPTARDKHDAALNVREAQLGVKEAKQAVTDARKKLVDEAKLGGAGDVKGARNDLESAQINLIRATDRLSDAQADQNDVLHSGDETSKKVTDAVKNLDDAQTKLTDATQNQADAEAALAQGGSGGAVADHARAIRNAYDQLVTAGQSWIKKMIEQKAPSDDVVAALDDENTAAANLIKTMGDPDGKLQKFIDANNALRLIFTDDKFMTNFNRAAQIIGGLHGVTIPDFLGSDATGFPGRASGGQVLPFTTYRMGEKGPELLEVGSTHPPDKLGKGRSVAEMSGRSASGARTFIVGANGPQIITMGAEPGWVTPNHELPNIDGHRAGGGPVLPGRTYVVGEHGPETLTIGGVNLGGRQVVGASGPPGLAGSAVALGGQAGPAGAPGAAGGTGIGVSGAAGAAGAPASTTALGGEGGPAGVPGRPGGRSFASSVSSAVASARLYSGGISAPELTTETVAPRSPRQIEAASHLAPAASFGPITAAGPATSTATPSKPVRATIIVELAGRPVAQAVVDQAELEGGLPILIKATR